MQTRIPCFLMRGGSSKGLYFKSEALPADEALRDRVLVAAMGADASQIDGAGGAHPLTSKVAIVSRSPIERRRRRLSRSSRSSSARAASTRRRTAATCSRASALRDRDRARARARRRDAGTRAHAQQRQPLRVARADAGQARHLRRRRPHRRRARHRGADRLQLPRRRGLGDGRLLPTGSVRRRRGRCRDHVHRQRHAGRRAARDAISASRATRRRRSSMRTRRSSPASNRSACRSGRG